MEFGSARQAAENDRTVARMTTLLACLSENPSGMTANGLCAPWLIPMATAASLVHACDSPVVRGVATPVEEP